MAKKAKKELPERNFIGGSGREYIFKDGGQIINMFVKFEDLEALPRTDKGYIRFVMAERKEPDQFKNTHYIYEDTFVPEKKDAPADKGDAEVDPDDNDADDLPF